jgi:hypothetical protein
MNLDFSLLGSLNERMGRSVRWYPLMGKYVSTAMTGEVAFAPASKVSSIKITCHKRVGGEDLEVIESEKRQGQHTDGDAWADAVLLHVDVMLDAASSKGTPLQCMLTPVVESRL